MVNEKWLIDATELKNFFGFMRKMWSASEIMHVINECETVDAVEVVRCKDCRYAHFANAERLLVPTEHGVIHCTNTAGLYTSVYTEDFCSYGERREGE